ncbi:MAG: nitrile hydratase accessory protein [Acidimicrobiales bacterium]
MSASERRGDRASASEPGADGPVFSELWEAEVFAAAQLLIDAGLFSGAEWSEALGEAIAAARARGDADLGDTYYEHWLAALESLCRAKGALSAAELDRRAREWRLAYERTPHGQPVELAAGQGLEGRSPQPEGRG